LRAARECESFAREVAVALAVKGIQHLNLQVADLGRARAFYTELLGFEVSFAKGDTVWLDAGGDLLGLSAGAPHAARSEGEAPSALSFEHFGFMVDAPAEVDRWAEQLRAHGVTPEKGPYDRSDGRSIYFRDPDGHLLEIFWVDPAFLAKPSRR
jgi:catechol 2,3-dioxygenase-like lactoylglutathione lyase family enzyme